MVTQVCIHQDNVFVLALLEAVNVGGTKAQFAFASSQDNFVSAINLDELFDTLLCAIGRIVVDDDDFHWNTAKIGQN